MAYADLIKELFRRSEMQVNEYAQAIDISVTHLSNIINDAQPGSRKILEACLARIQMDIGSLELPEADAHTEEEKTAFRLFRRLDPGQGQAVISVMRQFTKASKRKTKPPPSTAAG